MSVYPIGGVAASETKRIPAVVVMAKKPALGANKTRLAGALDEHARLELYRALLLDRIDQLRELRGVRPCVAFSPPEAEAEMRALVGEGVGLIAQRGADLGERLANASEEVLDEGAPAVLLVDSDTPTVPLESLEEAVRALTSGAFDTVLGPAWDGGYYLIGLSTPCRALFEGIRWSTPSVLSETISAARVAKRRVHFLPSACDVDTPDDLARVARQLAAIPCSRPGFPVRTNAALQRLSPGGLESPRDERWKTLAIRLAYQNRWIRVTESVVEIEPERHTLYGVVQCAPCVGVLPMVGPDDVLLVRQFRFVARRFTWEIPTGGVNPQETTHDAARRELREETGYACGALRQLSTYHTSKSVVDEVAHLFLARELQPAPGAAQDETESITSQVFGFDEALGMVRSGEIVDSMSVIAILSAALERPAAR